MNRVYRVNVNSKSITPEILKDDYKLFGGRGLIANVLNDEVNPKCDPFGAENKLIFATSLFAGTSVPTAHRLSVGGKSPLTGGIKEANVGGTAATFLAGHGIKMIIVEDVPQDDRWYNIVIDSESNIHLVAADEYRGINNYELVDRIREQYDSKSAVISIGVAGERGYKTSTLQVTDNTTGHPARAAARGGLGAVMGSKKIKAILIEKARTPMKVECADKKLFDNGRRKFIEELQNHDMTGQALPLMGTNCLVEPVGAMGALPVKNFTAAQYDKLEKIEPKAFLDTMQKNGGKTGIPCQPGCVIRCSNVYNDSSGKYVTSGLEYETVALFGPNCDITDWDAIAEFDRLCDDFGVDTIDVAVALGICMDEGKISWGDHQAALNLVREMMEGNGFAETLGNGAAAVGKQLGAKRVPVVKGQALAAYDPRNLKGLGVTYATSSAGADHTAGHTMSSGLDPYSKEGQVDASAQFQVVTALIDNTMCLFAVMALDAPEKFGILMHMLEGIYGGEWSVEKMFGIGVQTLALEKAFNDAAGFSEKDDRLPEFFYTEKSPMTGHVFDIDDKELQETFIKTCVSSTVQ